MPPDLQLLRPLWLLALIPLGLLLWRLARRGQAGDAWRGLVDEHLLAHLLDDDGTRVRRLPLVLLALGWLLGVVALAGPAWERLPQPVYQTEARRVLVLDISPSMMATDLAPSRLSRARFEVLDLLARSGEGQTALLAYGAEPFVVSPLTTDAETIAAQVPNLDTDLLPTQGARRTDLALEQAGELLRQAGASEGEVILITDGLDQSAAPQKAARTLREQGFRLSVLGVGTEQGAPVPLEGGGFHKDETGAILMPRLERAELTALADAGGGRYVTADPGEQDTLALIPDQIGGAGESASNQELKADQWREEGVWLLLALLPLAALAFRRGWLSPLVLAILITPQPPAHAFDWTDLWLRPDQQAARDLAAGDPAQAAGRFERPDWRAAAQYQAGEFASALQSLEDLQDTESAYNRGNSLARLGDLEEAVAEYEQVLDANAEHEDARHNLELLNKLLDQEQQQKQQQDQQQSGGDSKSDDQKGESQEQRGQGGGQDQAQDQSDAGDGGQQDSDQQTGQGGSESESQSQDQSSPEGSGSEKQGDQPATGAEPGDQDQGQDQPETQAGGKDESLGPDEKQAEPASAGEAGQEADKREASAAENQGPDNQLGPDQAQPAAGAEPKPEDLLGGAPQGTGQAVPAPKDLEVGEDRQAMEHMLRRVPDDPSGLLRQRFLLQHLRRNGRLP